MKLKLSLLLFFACLLSISQSGFNTESLRVTKSDLEQQIFRKDSTARAIVLYEIGNSYVNREDFKLHFEFKQKIKILNREGFDKATVEVLLYNNDSGKKEIVKNINATVYNINDGIVDKMKLSEADIIREKYNDNYTIVKFTFPNIREGSVINYSYEFISPFMFKYQSWKFQKDIPTLYSEYNASIPGNWEYNIKLVGGRKLFSNQTDIKKNCLEVGRGGSSNCATYRYVMKDIPAFIEEDFMTANENYLARIEYELNVFRGFDGSVERFNKTWKDTDSEIRKGTDFGRMIKKGNLVKSLIEDININEENDLKKTIKIYNYVKSNYNWNGELRLFNDVSIKSLINEKTGTASEINMLLYNLLKEHDIDAKPLLLSTRENGLVTKIYPVLTDFNYVLIHVSINGSTYLLDANHDYLSFGQIPFKCLNQYGRLLNNKSESTWFDISPDELSTLSYRIEVQLDNSENLNGSFEVKSTNYQSLNLKKEYFRNSEKFTDNHLNLNDDIEFSNANYNNVKQSDSTFHATYDISKQLESIGDKVYFNPYLIEFFSENPFKLQERSYPIDFGYKQSYVYACKLNIGEYTVDELPEPKKVNLPENAGAMIANYSVSGNAIIIYLKLSLNKTIYDSAYYEYLKELMKEVINTQKNTILVLNKKN